MLGSPRRYLIEVDYLASPDTGYDLEEYRRMAEQIVADRQARTPAGADGLDAVRHNLRALRSANLPDTQLIVCSLDGPRNFPDIDRLLASDEFADRSRRVVLTAGPRYLARSASANQIVGYQRRFVTAAQGQAN